MSLDESEGLKYGTYNNIEKRIVFKINFDCKDEKILKIRPKNL